MKAKPEKTKRIRFFVELNDGGFVSGEKVRLVLGRKAELSDGRFVRLAKGEARNAEIWALENTMNAAQGGSHA